MHCKKNINRPQRNRKKNKKEVNKKEDTMEENKVANHNKRVRVKMVPYVKEYNKDQIFNSKLDKVYRRGAVEYPIDVDKKREEWHNAYCEDLINMFEIMILQINKHFPQNNTEWNNKIFNKFSKLIYHSSSKYVSKN